jgi:hypothetical protein
VHTSALAFQRARRETRDYQSKQVQRERDLQRAQQRAAKRTH